MTGRLDGKVCLVTGTGGAIGRASAKTFAREGAKVIGCDVVSDSASATQQAVREAGGQMLSLSPCDLSKFEECERLVAFALAEFGRIDVLFNNASRPTFSWIKDEGNDPWFQTIDNELHLVYLLCKAAWPALCESHGTIVNMASVAAWMPFPAIPGLAHSAAKGGVLSMTRHLAMEGREFSIRANTISPGPVANSTILSMAKENPEWDQALRSKIMRGTYGTPEEIASVALFLASDESSFVNGADILADGGVTAW